MQSFTCCFAMDYLRGEDHTIEKPREYAFWRDYVPAVKPPWPGRLLSWPYSEAVTSKPTRLETDPEKGTGLWTYRRIADKALFVGGTYPGDISLVNWPQNDYMLGNLCEVDRPGKGHWPLDLSAHSGQGSLCWRHLPWRYLAGELAAERLHARQPLRSKRRGSGAPRGPGQAAQSLAALLASDRSAPTGRRNRLEGNAITARRGRHGGRVGEVSLHRSE